MRWCCYCYNLYAVVSLTKKVLLSRDFLSSFHHSIHLFWIMVLFSLLKTRRLWGRHRELVESWRQREAAREAAKFVLAPSRQVSYSVWECTLVKFVLCSSILSYGCLAAFEWIFMLASCFFHHAHMISGQPKLIIELRMHSTPDFLVFFLLYFVSIVFCIGFE